MSEKLNEIAKGSFLRVNEEGKAYWGQSEGGGGVQPDLSQTDTTKPDYVKGVIRKESLPEGYPYKEMGKEVVITEQSLDVTKEDNGLYGNFGLIINIVDGADYEVLWNGDVYECKAFTLTLNNNDYFFIGNSSLMGFEGGNGEPFVIMNVAGLTVVYSQTSGTYSFGLNRFGEVTHPISLEYVPGVVLVVRFIDGVVSHTAAEIIRHIMNGGLAYLRTTTEFFPCNGIGAGSVSFGGFSASDFKNINIYTIHDQDGTVEVVKRVGTISMESDFTFVS